MPTVGSEVAVCSGSAAVVVAAVAAVGIVTEGSTEWG